ncbi:hypothetical protein ACKWTF_008473 [Chironomus riparius]
MSEELEYESFECLEDYYEENSESEIYVAEDNDQSIKFFTTSSGNEKLSFDEYSFYHNKTTGSISYFQCANKNIGCKSRIKVVTTENGICNVFPPKLSHDHIVKPIKTATEIALSNLREKAAADGSRPCQILNDFLADPENRYINANFPSRQALTQRVQRVRVKNSEKLPPEPESLDFEYDRVFCSIYNEFIVLGDWCENDGFKRVTFSLHHVSSIFYVIARFGWLMEHSRHAQSFFTNSLSFTETF